MFLSTSWVVLPDACKVLNARLSVPLCNTLRLVSKHVGDHLLHCVQPEMKAVLEAILAPEEDTSDTAVALGKMRSESGHSLLGFAVSRGEEDAVSVILAAVRYGQAVDQIHLRSLGSVRQMHL